MFGNLNGTVGHGHALVRQDLLEPCPVHVLLKTLWRREPGKVKTLAINNLHATTCEPIEGLAHLARRGILLKLTGVDLTPTDAEVRLLFDCLLLSRAPFRTPQTDLSARQAEARVREPRRALQARGGLGRPPGDAGARAGQLRRGLASVGVLLGKRGGGNACLDRDEFVLCMMSVAEKASRGSTAEQRAASGPPRGRRSSRSEEAPDSEVCEASRLSIARTTSGTCSGPRARID